MRLPLFQIDAFTDRPFGGNPAAVCPLDSWLPDQLMQSIAAENNLSETAFLVPSEPAGGSAEDRPVHELRWFTPEVEVDLCGHATLAAGHVVFEHLSPGARSVTFSTRSGVLVVDREPGVLRMDLPADPRPKVAAPEHLAEILGVEPTEVLGGSTWIAVLEDASRVSGLAPDPGSVGRLDPAYLSVTAPGVPDSGVDFVSRFFAPGAGIDEDPVTGSAHCALMPYWSDRLGRNRLRARQVSARGGELDCELLEDRVVLRGRCAEVLRGMLEVPDPD